MKGRQHTPRDRPAIGTKAKRWLRDTIPKHGQDSNSTANVDTHHTICCTALNKWYVSTYETWFKINSLCNYLRPGWRVHESCQYFTVPSAKRNLTTFTYEQQNQIGVQDPDFLLILDILNMTSLSDSHFICLLHSSDACYKSRINIEHHNSIILWFPCPKISQNRDSHHPLPQELHSLSFKNPDYRQKTRCKSEMVEEIPCVIHSFFKAKDAFLKCQKHRRFIREDSICLIHHSQ